MPEGRAAPCPLDLRSEVRDEPHTVCAGCWGQVRGHLFVALLRHGLQGDGTAMASGKAGCPGVPPQGVGDRARPAQAGDLYAGEAGPRPPGTGAAIFLGSAGLPPSCSCGGSAGPCPGDLSPCPPPPFAAPTPGRFPAFLEASPAQPEKAQEPPAHSADQKYLLLHGTGAAPGRGPAPQRGACR